MSTADSKRGTGKPGTDRPGASNVIDLAERRSRRQGAASSAPDVHRTLEAIAARSRELRREARAAGLFTHDRELLDCQACALREDVTAEGYLFTYFGTKARPDSGLRFQEAGERGMWTCPACGARVAEPADG